ncbi:MAG: 3-oxoacyl-ACP reductase family protein [Chthoniobacterales bacterium]
MNISLKGKVALVTGASRGIGAAIAKRLAASGASVMLTYNTSPQKAEETVTEIHAAGGKAAAFQANSGDAVATRNAVAKTVETFGGLDILVNNAGVVKYGKIDELSLEDFDHQLAVNVRGVYVAIKEASPHLREGGRIINIGSCVATHMPFPGASAYAMTKAAVAGLTRGLAVEFAARGITVNTVQPGPIDTDMSPATDPGAEMLHGFLAIRRHGSADEVASMVAFLASQEAAYTTGASFAVDGGFGA